MYISEKEHARLRYMERAIERLVEVVFSTEDPGIALWSAARVLEPFRIARENRRAMMNKIVDEITENRLVIRSILAAKSGFKLKSEK